MASTGKHLSLLFLFSLLSFHPSHARELNSFSKFTNSPSTTTTTTTPNAKETVVVPNKEQEPSFLPDTQSGYGLYGHESGQLPPTTATPAAKTTTDTFYTTAKTTTDAPYTATPDTKSYPYSYYNKEAYATDPQGMSDTRFMDKGTTTTYNNPYKEAYVTDSQGYNNNNKNYYNGANNYYNTEKQRSSTDTSLIDGSYTTTSRAATTEANNYYYNGANNNYNTNTQKQGMSDTRYLANGKYYYSVPKENNFGNNGYEKYSRGVNYNNKGYYGNNENTYMEGYQNQEQFQENEDEFVP